MNAIETSKTHKMYLLLKERITSGALQPGHRLPSEPSLAASHGLSRVTIRRALEGLSRDGLIVRQPGAGTFVNGRLGKPPVVADLANMLTHLATMGRETQVRLLAFDYARPSTAIAEALKLQPDERTQSAVRVRYFADKPFSHLSTHVPERIGVTYSKEDLATTPLLTLLERSGVMVERADQTLSATLAGPEVAAALDVEVGSALIWLTRVVYGKDGRGIEHLSALYRPDVHAFHMAMLRSGDSANRHWRPATGAAPSTERRPTAAARRRP